MPQLLLELFSEDIPARMQNGAASDLARLARERLAAASLAFETMETHAGLRRLTLVVEGLPAALEDRIDSRRGPRIGAPEAAVEGFLRSAGVTRAALTERDGFLQAAIPRPGRRTPDILAELLPELIRAFPWPKSMVSAAGRLKWVRPLRRILCVFDGQIVPFAIEGLESADLSEGHRFMGEPRVFSARDFAAYREALAARYVVLSVAERREAIASAARALCEARGLTLVEDDGLLEEIAGMVEWPTPLLGAMDPAFLDLPPEVIRTSMRVHQRYFAVRDPAGLAPFFITVANIVAADGGRLIAAGNARVLSARLNDARFFWDEDRAIPLAERLPRLDGVVFHARLGTVGDRVRRLEALAERLAPLVGAPPAVAARAARLAKADLTSGMVGEFPELQGVMGGYYARAEGLDGVIADAIADHYRPQGPTDSVPSAPVSVAVALADKLDALTGFFSIDERPTGSRDPYALRRAALGVIRLILENGLRVSLTGMIATAAGPHQADTAGVAALWPFFVERLKVRLREQGARHDLVDAVLALGDDDLTRVCARIAALSEFLATDDGANLLAGFKRASNILAAEARKADLPAGDPVRVDGSPQEAALFDALAAAGAGVRLTLDDEDFAGAMTALSALRGPVDAFFAGVLVNSEVAAERDNRLRLLIGVRAAMQAVADFSLVAG